MDSLLDAIRSFRITNPVIDTDNDDELPGLRSLRDELRRDCEVTSSLLSRQRPSNASTNAPYLVAVWGELVHARHPVAIYRTFSPGRTSRPVKVDVVADNGARWVRVNTIKNARLMMEFREIDSYLTSDEDDDETRPQSELDNSVLRMGRELLAAAKANPISVLSPSTVPQVTIRLTRLDPFKDDAPDPRIGMTIQRLRDLGIDVQLGERSLPPKAPAKPDPLHPTTNINLDLSALIALISDISHSPLPRTQQEAHARFEPPQSYLEWKKDRVKSLARQSHDLEDGDITWENSGQHSRTLAAQAIREMDNGLLQQIHERISTHAANVTFWTTREARHRCIQIVSKIGGERERRRADALFGSTLCTRTSPVPAPAHVRQDQVARAGAMDDAEKALADAYWGQSRYPVGFLPLVPVHVYPSVLPSVADEERQSGGTFFDALASTCTRILSHEATPVSQEASPLSAAKDTLEEIPPAAQTSLPKLTVHTVTSMLAGASREHTTLTTNRSSVKAILREMRRACGIGGYEPGVDKAALWILDPRSLSEGMRSE